jgi:hypothetical protein
MKGRKEMETMAVDHPDEGPAEKVVIYGLWPVIAVIILFWALIVWLIFG